MNDPIIPLWIIYAIDVCNSINEVTIFFSVLGVFAIIFVFITMLVDGDLDDLVDGDLDGVDNIRYKKLLKILTIFTTVFIIMAIIVPDKRVGYTMLATQYITKGEVQQAADMVDRIADKIIRMKNN